MKMSRDLSRFSVPFQSRYLWVKLAGPFEKCPIDSMADVECKREKWLDSHLRMLFGVLLEGWSVDLKEWLYRNRLTCCDERKTDHFFDHPIYLLPLATPCLPILIFHWHFCTLHLPSHLKKVIHYFANLFFLNSSSALNDWFTSASDA